MADKPEPGKQYRLTGASDVASIMRGDSWAESEVVDYLSRSARDAHAAGQDESYCDYLDAHARELRDYYLAMGDEDTAAAMLTRTLSESLRGNDGE